MVQQEPKVVRPSAARPMTEAEKEREEKVVQVFQAQIDQIKSAIRDKEIIFGKLKAEILRMLRVFEKVQNLSNTKEVEAEDIEQTVNTFSINFFLKFAQAGGANLGSFWFWVYFLSLSIAAP